MSHSRRGGDSGENVGVNPGLLRSARRAAALAVGGLVPAIALGLVRRRPRSSPTAARCPTVPPDPANLLLGWSGDPLVWLPAIVALRPVADRRAAGEPGAPGEPGAARRGPGPGSRACSRSCSRWTRGSSATTRRCSRIHMVQHMLLTLVAPLLLLYAGPITLLLRASSAETRRRWIFPFLHSRVVRFLSFPVVSWLLFAAVMWGEPLLAAVRRRPGERVAPPPGARACSWRAALLFWWPVVGPDPSPWRMKPAAKVLYVGPADAAEHVPRRRDLHVHGAALPRTT